MGADWLSRCARFTCTWGAGFGCVPKLTRVTRRYSHTFTHYSNTKYIGYKAIIKNNHAARQQRSCCMMLRLGGGGWCWRVIVADGRGWTRVVVNGHGWTWMGPNDPSLRWKKGHPQPWCSNLHSLPYVLAPKQPGAPRGWCWRISAILAHKEWLYMLGVWWRNQYSFFDEYSWLGRWLVLKEKTDSASYTGSKGTLEYNLCTYSMYPLEARTLGIICSNSDP